MDIKYALDIIKKYNRSIPREKDLKVRKGIVTKDYALTLDRYSYRIEMPYCIINSEDFVFRITITEKEFYFNTYYKNLQISTLGIMRNDWIIRILDNKKEVSLYNTREKIYTSGTDEYFSYIFCGNSDRKASKTIQEKVLNTGKAYSDEIYKLYAECVEANKDVYSSIKNKTEFKAQLLENIEIFYSADDFNGYISESRELFISFYDSENFFKNLRQEITEKSILAKYPDLDRAILGNKINSAINETIEEYENYGLIEDIMFLKEDETASVYKSIYDTLKDSIDEHNRNLVRKKYNLETIISLYAEKINEATDKKYLLKELSYFISIDRSTSEEVFIFRLNSFLDQFLGFEKFSSEFLSIYNDKEILINLTDEKKALFKSFENGEISLNQELENEYKFIYLPVTNYFEDKFYIKNTKRLKPTFKSLPLYIQYVKAFVNELLNQEIIIESNGLFKFKKFENIKNLSDDILHFYAYYDKYK